MLLKNELISLYIDFSAGSMTPSISLLLQGEKRKNLSGRLIILALED